MALAALVVLSCQSTGTLPQVDTEASQPAVYVEACETCHAAVVTGYAESGHAGKHLPCGSCHEPAGHPDFTRPAGDGTCGGCHPAQLQQARDSAHFRTRALLPLTRDGNARRALRAQDFVFPVDGRGHFAGDQRDGAAGGRLCAGCHLDGHRFRPDPGPEAETCTGCHDDRAAHFPIPMPGTDNRCVACHVRVGETVRGQTIHSHRFARPGQ